MENDSSVTRLRSLKQYSSASASRLQSLYSDFAKQKLSNPAGYQANIDWWSGTLETVALRGWQPSGDALVLHANADLAESLRLDKLGKPLGLGSIVTELSTSGRIFRLNEFLTSPNSIYATASIASTVASYLVVKPLWWALEQLSITGGADTRSSEEKWKTVKGQYVILSNVEKAADAVIEHQRTKSRLSIGETLHNSESFRETFASVVLPGATLSESDLAALIKYLQRDRQVLVSDKNVLKFVDPDAEGAPTVTTVDVGVLEMKIATQRLSAQVDEIQRQIVERTAKAKEHVKLDQKAMALSYIRSRKHLEELLSKRLNSLETIQTAFMKIESAAGDIEIMKAYTTSTATLKTLLAHPSLQRDHIDATMESMADTLADHAEIEQAIQIGGQSARVGAGVEDIDETELEAELEELVKFKQMEDLQKAQAEKEKAAKEKAEHERKEREAERERIRREEQQRERDREKVAGREPEVLTLARSEAVRTHSQQERQPILEQ